ncbi:MAG TPA: hypothetical protein VFI95_18630 [Terriglobales bacterium]|nr:hypothetical protein [Terriglobales bacterium]
MTEPNQRMYVNGIAAGKTKKQAAIAAGYSAATAKNAAAIIERAGVKKAFEELIQQAIPLEKIIELLAEGLNARETKVFMHEGGVIYSRPMVNFSERRHYLELIAKYGGYYVDRQEIELADQQDDLPLDQLITKTEALLATLTTRPEP